MRIVKQKAWIHTGMEFYHVIDDVTGAVTTELRDREGWFLKSIHSVPKKPVNLVQAPSDMICLNISLLERST